jgi:hypothetical protein
MRVPLGIGFALCDGAVSNFRQLLDAWGAEGTEGGPSRGLLCADTCGSPEGSHRARLRATSLSSSFHNALSSPFPPRPNPEPHTPLSLILPLSPAICHKDRHIPRTRRTFSDQNTPSTRKSRPAVLRQSNPRMKGLFTELLGLGKGVATEAKLTIADGVSEGVCRSVW